MLHHGGSSNTLIYLEVKIVSRRISLSQDKWVVPRHPPVNWKVCPVGSESASDLSLVDEVVTDLRRECPHLDSLAVETVCRLIYAGRKMEQRAARVLKPFGLNYTDLDVLGTLRRSGTPYELTPADLLRSAMLTSGAMSTCLNRLEKAGMIGRRVGDVDRRVRWGKLTRKGLALIRRVHDARFADAHTFLQEMKRGDVRQLNRLLRDVVAADHRVLPD